MVPPKHPPRSIRLPKPEDDKLAEEVAATGRSFNGIITEALQIRRAALEALGLEAGGVGPEELAEFVAQCVRAGVKAMSGR